MIEKTSKQATTEELLSLMHPIVSRWFSSKFGQVTEAQAMAVPLIHSRKNVLVSSPTGSGKTLTAFLSILNELILLSSQGKLEERIYAVYVSPLKALANDINENLMKPLGEISALFESYSKGKELDDRELIIAASSIVPLSMTMREEISKLERWASNRSVKASR